MRFEELMNRYYQTFSENEKYVCRYIVEHKKDCCKKSIDEFAKECHVSKTMLVRFAKKLSLPGFGELKAMIRLETEEQMAVQDRLLEDVTGSYHKMIDDFYKRDLTGLFEKIRAAGRILIYGSGSAQSHVASEFKRIFLPANKPMFHIYGHDMVTALCKSAKHDDLVVIISLTGEEKSILALAEYLRLKQIPSVSITRMQNNSLAYLCGENLYIHSIRIPMEYGIDYEIVTPYFILIELLFLRYQIFINERK
ncbi:SIS domain-containing protein [Clostridium sp. MCC353]|uniref:MurR/RpiR family transcriptional regulator n=1 Tax=Clostridium sp. MCC353 TaxID=2592646 RepID=UPI001C0247D0|nr:MurR/RpiR family transcriptional regulator [Clostridium sp. MCC353]MBT9776433.1 SIS domain-containing protein [Clostridium sp. MCC353]